MLQVQATGLLHIIDQHGQSSNSSPLLEMGSSTRDTRSSFGPKSSGSLNSSGTFAIAVAIVVLAEARVGQVA